MKSTAVRRGMAHPSAPSCASSRLMLHHTGSRPAATHLGSCCFTSPTPAIDCWFAWAAPPPESFRGSSEAHAEPTEAQWAEDVALLEEYQRRLIDEIETTSLKNLRRIRTGKTSAIADELLGLAAHDAYHSGQIRLMARLSRK
jgi:hypothetical protein